MNFLDPRLPSRFWNKCIPEPTSGCWLWLAALNEHGYGAFRFERKMRLSHRVAYHTLVGDVPDGLELDHRCSNTVCCNPDHLEPVTHRVNVLRSAGLAARYASRSVCSKGHPLDDRNTYRWRGIRICRTCGRAAQARAREKTRAA